MRIINLNRLDLVVCILLASPFTSNAAFVPTPSTAGKLSCLERLQSSINPYDDDVVMSLPLMEAQLASRGPNPALEIKIENAKLAAEFSVRRAQVQFYEAFAAQSIEMMRQVWSTQHDCKVIHPGMSSIQGRENVLKSWEEIFSRAEPFMIEPSLPQVDICGQTAICTCVERMNGGGELEAVNIYKREKGHWRLTLHIASPIVVHG